MEMTGKKHLILYDAPDQPGRRRVRYFNIFM